MKSITAAAVCVVAIVVTLGSEVTGDITDILNQQLNVKLMQQAANAASKNKNLYNSLKQEIRRKVNKAQFDKKEALVAQLNQLDAELEGAKLNMQQEQMKDMLNGQKQLFVQANYASRLRLIENEVKRLF